MCRERYLMTPVFRTKDGIRQFSGQWKAEFKGKKYWVSCRQLDCPNTVGDSWKAANDWIKQIKAKATLEPVGIKSLLNEYKGSESDFWGKMSLLVENWHDLPIEIRDSLNERILGKEKLQVIEQQANSLYEQIVEIPKQKTIAKQIDRWNEHNLVRHGNGKLSANSYDIYQRTILKFADFVGKETSIENINYDMMDRYWQHCSPNHQQQWEVAKAFVNWLVDCEIIDPIRGLRRLRISSSEPKNIVTWTQEEFKKAYDEQTGLNRLVLCLAANCGWQTADMGTIDLGTINWEDGTIERCRKKTGKKKTIWKLWPETIELLKAHGQELHTVWGTQLIDGKLKRRHGARFKTPKPLVNLRHTSISIVANSIKYRAWRSYFACHADKGSTITDKHYSKMEVCEGIAEELHQWYFGSK